MASNPPAAFDHSVFISNFLFVVTFRFYQVRCSLRVSPRLSAVQIEASVLENLNKEITSATVIRGAGTSHIFQILYRNEEVILKDTVLFRVRLPGNYPFEIRNLKMLYGLLSSFPQHQEMDFRSNTHPPFNNFLSLSSFSFLSVTFFRAINFLSLTHKQNIQKPS